jgi:hypothetical protein
MNSLSGALPLWMFSLCMPTGRLSLINAGNMPVRNKNTVKKKKEGFSLLLSQRSDFFDPCNPAVSG